MATCALVGFGPLRAFDWVQRLTWPKAIILTILFYYSFATMFVQSFNPFLYFQF